MKKSSKLLLLSIVVGSGMYLSKSVVADDVIMMFRVYNPNSGEHFYTANGIEKNNLLHLGWKYEGVGWYAPNEGDPVYRLYNPNNGDHHYTLNVAEKNMLVSVGWRYEHIGWQSATKNQLPLYRVYNPNNKGAGSHHYTVNKAEVNHLVSLGWKDEGIGWYAVAGYTGKVPDPYYIGPALNGSDLIGTITDGLVPVD